MRIEDELDQSEDDILNFLEHFGVKGQKWGVRKARGDRSAFKKRAKAKAQGPDIKKLSNEELRTIVSRMQLEKQYMDLAKQTNRSKGTAGKKFAKDILTEVGKQHAKKILVEGISAVGTIATGAYIAKKMLD